MSQKSGTISLGTTRVIEFYGPSDKLVSIQLKSSDVSETTTFNLEISADGDNWDVATDSAGSDISDTLVQDETKVVTYDVNPQMYYRINFSGSTTGDVDYIVTF